MPERLNIKHFTAEPEREPEAYFDPERDMTEEDRQAIADIREQKRRAMEWYSFSSPAVFEALLGEKIDLSMRERSDAAMLREGLLRQQGYWGDFAPLASLELLLGGQIELSSRERTAVATLRGKEQRDKNWYHFSELATLELLLGERIELLPQERKTIASKRQRSRVRQSYSDFSTLTAFEILYDRQARKPNLDSNIEPLPQSRTF